MKSVSTYWSIILNSVKSRMAFRTDFVVDMLFAPVVFLVVQLVWKRIYAYNDMTQIQGFTLQENITYFAISTIVGYFSWTWMAGRVGQIISQDEFTRYVLKPIGFFEFLFFDMLGQKLPSMLIKVPLLFILLFIFFNLYVNSSLIYWVLFLSSLVMSYLLFNTFMFLIGLFTFWEESHWVLSSLGRLILKFFSGSLMPIDFYPGFLKTIVNLLPFKHIYYSPIMIYLSKYSVKESLLVLVYQLVSVVLLYAVLKLVLKWGMREFTSQGG